MKETFMPWTSAHINWLVDTGQRLKTADGKDVQVWEFCHEQNEAILSAWATHFRNHYCYDSQIEKLREGTGQSRTEYLRTIKFPDSTAAPGPSIRAGDFAEILAADYLEFILKHWVPRTRYADKTIRNESDKGTDTIGFLFENVNSFSRKDMLTLIESKAKYTGKNDGVIQKAIDHSAKDVLRKAESLNAIKQKFIVSGEEENRLKIQRFQNEVENPYLQKFIALAHLDTSECFADSVNSVSTSNHPFNDSLSIVVIKGSRMMELVHELYRRAADEA
jgi:hypothetical protein